MKRVITFLFLTFLSAGIASAQTPPKFAVIEVRCDSTQYGTLYLTRSRETLQEFIPVDSVRPNTQHVYRLSVIPDASREYRLMLGHNLIAYDIYLARGDSLEYSYDALTGDSLRFDLVGANRYLRNVRKPWYRDRQYYKNLNSLNWDRWSIYLAGISDSLQAQALRTQRQFPGHAALYNVFKSNAQEIYYYGLLYYLYDNYWDSTGKPVTDAPNRLRILDSIPWTEEPLAHSDALYGLVAMWNNLSSERWRHAGIDTAGKKYSDEVFAFAHKLPAPARDVAELIAFNNAMYASSPSELVPTIEQELKTYRRLASDTAYLRAFKRQLGSLRSRLPGKGVPNFVLPDTSGIMRSIAEFRGKVIYLDFWGTWCPPCLEELPSLIKLEKSFEGDTNVKFIGIALEAPSLKTQSVAAWKKFIHAKGLNGTQLYAQQQFQNPTVKSYGVQAVPTLMLINRDGTFIDAAAPRPSSGKAEAAIRAALAGKNN